MSNGHRKGSQFERQVCKELSLWWTKGERDDVFWRSSQSGGRATQRAKKGQTTYGSYGDVAAVDPVGEPLVKAFTIELKRGRSHGTPDTLLDLSPGAAEQPMERTLLQAHRSHRQAGSLWWMVVLRRDRHESIVMLPMTALSRLSEQGPLNLVPPRAYYSVVVRTKDEEQQVVPLRFVALPFRVFLERFTRAHVKRVLREELRRKR